MSLEAKSKKELVDMVEALSAKLKELKGVEKVATSTAETLKDKGVGMYRDSDGVFHLVELKFDAEVGAAQISGTENLGKDTILAAHKMKSYAVLEIITKL